MTRIGRLHILTDETLQARFTHAELARLAAEAGAEVIQLREKRPRTTRELVETALAIRNSLPSDVQLIVNDRADVALAAMADGAHLGRNDLAPEVARRILGPDGLIGVTANSIEEARRWHTRPVSYIGAGPVYGTTSKETPAPCLGCDALRTIARESPVPVIAVGSITPERVAEVMATGVHGFAVISGVVGAKDPGDSTRLYREELERFLAVAGASR